MGFIVFFDILHNKKYGLSQFCTFCISEFHREVAYYLGLESITLYSILNFMMRHSYQVCASYIIVRLAQLYLLSITTVKLYAGGDYKLQN